VNRQAAGHFQPATCSRPLAAGQRQICAILRHEPEQRPRCNRQDRVATLAGKTALQQARPHCNRQDRAATGKTALQQARPRCNRQDRAATGKTAPIEVGLRMLQGGDGGQDKECVRGRSGLVAAEPADGARGDLTSDSPSLRRGEAARVFCCGFASGSAPKRKGNTAPPVSDAMRSAGEYTGIGKAGSRITSH
jgi:hypothetical protein